MVRRKTANKRMVAKLRAIKAELRYRMHEPVASVGEWLQKVVVGYYQYHAVPGNMDRLRVFGQRFLATYSKPPQPDGNAALGSIDTGL